MTRHVHTNFTLNPPRLDPLYLNPTELPAKLRKYKGQSKQ